MASLMDITISSDEDFDPNNPINETSLISNTTNDTTEEYVPESSGTTLDLSSDSINDQTITNISSSNGSADGNFVSPLIHNLRSKCAQGLCPLGVGLLFRSRISPSPSR